MIEWLNDIDTKLFLLLNSFNNDFFDTVMFYISKTSIWVPFYIVIIVFILKRDSIKNGAIALLFLIITVAIADFTSVHLFKEVFQRFRPCHNVDLQGLVHIVNNKCGGQYGFISSHAANTFAIASFFSLLLNNKYIWISMLLWSSIISYSRIYLGVHYPGDVLVGALWGTLISLVLFKIYKSISIKYKL